MSIWALKLLAWSVERRAAGGSKAGGQEMGASSLEKQKVLMDIYDLGGPLWKKACICPSG